MSNPRFVLAAFAASLLIAGCGGGQQPTVDTPAPPSGPTPEELAELQRIQDSIRQAEEEAAARAAAEEQARAQARAAAAARDTLTQTVYFDYDESAIRTDTEDALRKKAEILQANPGVRLRMEGHADERGTSEYNIALGNDRAESVMRFLTNFGLSDDRFTWVSYGEEQPAVQGTGEQAWRLNRRVEFVITAGGDAIVGS